MKYEEIIKLLDAGYSREEILQMDEHEPEPAAEPEPAPEPEPEPAPDMSGIMDEMKKMFSDLTKELTAANIMRSRIDGDDTNEDIIAKIINPKIDKNGGK